MAHLEIFGTDDNTVSRVDGQTCDRCGRRNAECVEFQTDHHYSLTFCLMSCWPQLVEAIGLRRKLEDD